MSFIVRQNVGTVRAGHVVIDRVDVASCAPLSRTEWNVTLTDGQVWHVKREKGG